MSNGTHSSLIAEKCHTLFCDSWAMPHIRLRWFSNAMLPSVMVEQCHAFICDGWAMPCTIICDSWAMPHLSVMVDQCHAAVCDCWAMPCFYLCWLSNATLVCDSWAMPRCRLWIGMLIRTTTIGIPHSGPSTQIRAGKRSGQSTGSLQGVPLQYIKKKVSYSFYSFYLNLM